MSQREEEPTGEPPDPLHPLPGCRYQSGCPLATAQCRAVEPPLEEKTPGTWAACWER